MQLHSFASASSAMPCCTHALVLAADRPSDSWPGAVWGDLVEESKGLHTSLPTNAWWENIVLGKPTQDRSENGIAAIPYTIDTAGDISGMRVHFPRVFAASDLIVMTQSTQYMCISCHSTYLLAPATLHRPVFEPTTKPQACVQLQPILACSCFDWRHALQLGTVDKVSPHNVAEPGPLSITLQWKGEMMSDRTGTSNTTSYMQSPVVRGAPYITMEYFGLQPMIYARQEVTKLLIDGREFKCNTAGVLVTIHREAEIQFSGFVSSDMTWLVFTSHSVEMLCKHGFVKESSNGCCSCNLAASLLLYPCIQLPALGDPPTPGALGEWRTMPRFSLSATLPAAVPIAITAATAVAAIKTISVRPIHVVS
eukprot:21217-Heterococcus_DN1.PRE.2